MNVKFRAFEPLNLKENSSNYIDLNLDDIVFDEDQPRKYFDVDSLQNLAESIKRQGVIQPITVVRIVDKNKYKLIAGERRVRAAKMAGLKEVPAIVRENNKLDSQVVAIVENIQRENLNPMEEAAALWRLKNEFELKDDEIADTIGRPRSSVTNLLRLLTLSEKAQELVRNGLLELGHAKVLLGLKSYQQYDAAQYVVERNLSVRETEKLVVRIKNQEVSIPVEILPSQWEIQFQQWQRQLSSKFPYSVKVKMDNQGKGSLIIKFESPQEAEHLITNLKFEE